MEVGEDPAFRRHAIEVRRFVGRRAERADVGVAHVVDEDDDDVRRAVGGLLSDGFARHVALRHCENKSQMS